jgi:hypothetical protein
MLLKDNMNNNIYHTIRQTTMYTGKIVDICAALSQTHMYMESEYILFVLESGALTHTFGYRFLFHFFQ